VIEHPTGAQNQRVFFIRQLGGRDVLDRGELPQAAGELSHVQDRRPGVILVFHRPLESLPPLQARVAYPGVAGSQGCDLRHDLFRRGILPSRIAAWMDRSFPAGEGALRQAGDNPPVFPGLALCLDGFAHSLDAPFGVRERPVFLREADARQEHIGVGRGFGGEDLLHDDKIAGFQAALDVVGVWVARHGVLAHDIQRLDLPLQDARDHLGHGHPAFSGIPSERQNVISIS